MGIPFKRRVKQYASVPVFYINQNPCDAYPRDFGSLVHRVKYPASLNADANLIVGEPQTSLEVGEPYGAPSPRGGGGLKTRPGERVSPPVQLEDGPLAADQVHEVFQSLLDAVAAGSATTTSSSPPRSPPPLRNTPSPPCAQWISSGTHTAQPKPTKSLLLPSIPTNRSDRIIAGGTP